MNRRALLAGATAGLLLPGAVRSQPSEWDAFNKLGDLFTSLLQSSDKIAAAVDRARLLAFLHGVYRPLSAIKFEKEKVRDLLAAANCKPSGRAGRERAEAAAKRVRDPLPPLAAATRTLATAVAPTDLREPARKTAELMSGLNTRAMWVERVKGICPTSTNEARRLSMLNEVRASIEIVRECNRRLDALIDGLS